MVGSLDAEGHTVLERLTARLRAKGLLPAAATLVLVRASRELDLDGSNFVRIRKV